MSAVDPVALEELGAPATAERLCRYQDLSRFTLPQGFRGRSAGWVQLWWIVQASLFRHSPQFAYGWRRWLLRAFGAQVGRNVLLRPSVTVTYPWKVSIGDWSWIGDDAHLYSLGPIRIGSHAVVSQGSYVCTGSHDMTRPGFDIHSMETVIEDEAWLAARVFVMPGVRIGRGAVVAAGSLVASDLPGGQVCFGHPARPVRPRPCNPAG